MRRILLIGMIVSFPILLLGQKDNNHIKIIVDEPNLEFGYNLFSMTNLHPNIINNTAIYLIDKDIFSGIYLKYNFKQKTVRFTLDYYQSKVFEVYSDSTYYQKDKGEYNGLEFRLGYEKHYGSKRLIPFVYSDLVYSYAKYNGYNWGEFYPANFYFNHFNIYRDELSFSLGSGLKYNLTSQINLTYENNIQIGCLFNYDTKRDMNKRHYKELFYKVNPIRALGISIILR